MNLLTTTVPLSAYLFTFAVHTCTKRLVVSAAILSNALISHEPNRYSYEKENILTYLLLFHNSPESFTAFSETRLRDKEL